MRATTELLCEHLELNLALIAESYIIKDGLPADMASAGHWEIVSEFDAHQLDSALYGACRGDSIALVQHVLSLGASDYDFGLLGACCGDSESNRDAGELMLSLGANLTAQDYFHAVARFGNSIHMVTWLTKHKVPNDADLEAILCGGLFNGNMEVVHFAVQNGASHCRMTFFDACAGGDTGMVLLGLINGGSPAIGLAGASSGGHIPIIQQMIRLGATNYDHALLNAVIENHLAAVQYMLDYIIQHKKEINATVLNDTFSIAVHNNYFEIARMLITYGAKKCTHSHYCTQPWSLHVNALQSQETLSDFLRMLE